MNDEIKNKKIDASIQKYFNSTNVFFQIYIKIHEELISNIRNYVKKYFNGNYNISLSENTGRSRSSSLSSTGIINNRIEGTNESTRNRETNENIKNELTILKKKLTNKRLEK